MPKATRARTNSPKAPAKRAASATAEKTNGNAQPELESAIRSRAYELYEERGRQDGFDQEDWFQAEAEVVAQYQKRTA